MQIEIITPIVVTFLNISPINSITEGIQRGHYTRRNKYAPDEKVQLATASGAKTLHLVCLNKEVVSLYEYAGPLRELNMQLCRYAPNYLLGLLAEVEESQMSEMLLNRGLIAFENRPRSCVFIDRTGSESFLIASRWKRNRELAVICPWWKYSQNYTFLAEDLVS